MNQEQIEIDHICRWSKVLTMEAYGTLLERVNRKRKILNYYHSPYDCLTAEDIDKIVIDIMNQ